MSWVEVDGSATIAVPSNMYDVALIPRNATGESMTALIFTDPDAAIRIGQEMVRVGELVKERRNNVTETDKG